MTTLLNRRIDVDIATSQRVGIRLTRHHLGNDSRVAALLSVRYVIGLATREFGTTDMDGYYLTKATTVGLTIIRIATTSEICREWSARHRFRNDLRVAALLRLRNVIGLSTRQSGTGNLDGHYVAKAASMGLWII